MFWPAFFWSLICESNIVVMVTKFTCYLRMDRNLSVIIHWTSIYVRQFKVSKEMSHYTPLSVSKGASGSNCEYSKTLSTDVIWFSTSADCLTPHWNIPESSMAEEMARPISPPKASGNETISIPHSATAKQRSHPTFHISLVINFCTLSPQLTRHAHEAKGDNCNVDA